ncbi:glycosyltransferase [Roseobacter sp. HKCCA0882]|uniref:glycosyltransferase n=1 Tax=Roseobacter sp. HKCCA0882 TaxID=3120337 RepID=UPI0030EE1272
MGNNFFFGLGSEALSMKNKTYHDRMQRYAEKIDDLNIVSVSRSSKFFDVKSFKTGKVSFHIIQSKFPVLSVFYGIILILRLGAFRATIYFQDSLKFCLILVFFRAFLRARCIAGVHYEVSREYSVRIFLLRLFADKIRVLTFSQKKVFIKRGLNEDQISVVATPVMLLDYLKQNSDVSTYDRDLEKSVAPIKLIYVGRLAHTKRIGELLDFIRKYIDVHLTLVAPISSREVGFDVSRMARAVDKIDNVVWYDNGLWGDELIHMLAASDGLISFSSEEGFGKVYVEALALGIPVITRANAGAASIATVAKGMFLFHEVNELVLFFSNLKFNLGLEKTEAEKNKYNIREYFDPDFNINLFCDLFS